MKGQKGFTLIELMIVVAIIGVLSAVAIPAYKNYVTKSEVASAMATMKALITPLEATIQEKGIANVSLADIGTISGANPLGVIGTPTVTSTAQSIIFTFGTNSSINSETLKFEKVSGVWTCSQTTDVTIKGC
ncbi:TPA: pilin [Photobacterium damselae]